MPSVLAFFIPNTNEGHMDLSKEYCMTDATTMSGLTARYFLWVSGFISIQELLDDVRLYAYSYGQRRLNITEDQNSGFFLSMYGEWERLIRNFTYRGIPLEHFINLVLKQRIRGYLRAERRHKEREQVITNYTAFYEQVYESLQNWDDFERDEDEVPATTQALLNRIIKLPYFQAHEKACKIYILRNYCDIDPGQVDELAKACKCTVDELMSWCAEVDAALGSQTHRREQIQLLHDRQLLQLFSLQRKEKQAVDIDEETRIHDLVLKKRASIANTEVRIEKLRSKPSHRLIGQVLGIPAGTVSSIMIQIQKLLTEIKKKHTDGDPFVVA